MDKNNKFYGLTLSKKVQKLQTKMKSIFDSDDEDSAATQSKNQPSKQMIKNKNIEKKFLEEDPNIYEYDSIYDSIKEKETKKTSNTEKKKPRYIDNLLKAATKRKKDYEIRVEKQIQVERTKEGDEFADKDSFVTTAYKQKLAEMEAEEEKERLQSQLDEMMDVTKQKDLSGFYRHYLKQTIGEEKIPVFGDQNLMKAPEVGITKTSSSNENKELSKRDRTISKGKTEPDTEVNVAGTSDLHDQETEESKNIQETHFSLRTQNKSRSSSHEFQHKRSKEHVDSRSSSHRMQKEKRKSSDHDSDSDLSDRKLNKVKQKQAKELPEVNIDADYDDESSPSENEVEIPKEVDTEVEKKKEEIKKKKSISSLFTKRTVGAIFDQAQARYFERMASRNVNRKV